MDSQGEQLPPAPDSARSFSAAQVRFALSEAIRWGEPYWLLNEDDTVAFALPATWNDRVIGGIVVENLSLGSDAAGPRPYAEQLAEHLIASGILNGALMRERRAAAARERAQAEAIHSLKSEGGFDFRRLYSTEEPQLLIAMQKGDRQSARRSLNTILLAIYNQAASDLHTVKRYIGELVLLMQRALLECGLEPEGVLLSAYDPFTRLQEVHDEEALSEWTRAVLEGLMDASAGSAVETRRARLHLAIRFLRKHLHEPLDREGVARLVGISPAHFSHLLKLFHGRSFSELLTDLRLEKAVGLLRQPQLNLQTIAAECGFPEQAYFSRVFRKRFGVPPGAWRREKMQSAEKTKESA